MGNVWRRFTARERYRVPDVTSLAIEPNGRVWWGVEAGLMTFFRNEFYATDVSQGFITNDIRRLRVVPDQAGVVDVDTPGGQTWRGNPWLGWHHFPHQEPHSIDDGRHAADPKQGTDGVLGPTMRPGRGLDYF